MHLHQLHEPLSVRDANLARSVFANVTLADGTFDDVNLARARVTNANLAEATFVDVDLTNASIENATLTGLRIDGIAIDALLAAPRDGSRDGGAARTPAALQDDAGPATGTAADTTARAGAVVYATDVARLQAFYQGVAGLAVEATAADHVVLGAPALQLVIVRAPAHVTASIRIETPPRVRSETPIKLMLPVPDLAAARAVAPLYGGAVSPAEREWDFGGGRVCDGWDPEGNVVQLRAARH